MNDHALDNEVSTEINGRWVPAIPLPYFTIKGLPIWKRFNEANWRPQCTCKRIFDTLEDYHAHIVLMNSPYAALHSTNKSCDCLYGDGACKEHGE